jgi:hypothetical protein
VPLGTVVRDKETGEVLFEITEDGEKQVLSRGGKGGLGNWHFRSATNQTQDMLNLVYQDQRWMQFWSKSFSRCRFSRVSKCWKINIIVCSDIS